MKYKIQFADVQPPTPKTEIFGQPCYMGVSLNNQLFWSGHLPPLLKWMDARFPSCLVIIGDHLHRINEYIFNGKTGEDAIKEALVLGDELKQTISAEIEKMGLKNIRLERWQAYYDNPACSEIKAALFRSLEENDAFQESVYGSCRSFITRLHDRGIPMVANYDKAVLLSSQYLIEEMAVFSYLIESGIRVQVYPGTSIPVLKEIANGAFPGLVTNLREGIYADLNVRRLK